MVYDTLIKNGTLVTPITRYKADIGILDGKIAFIGSTDEGVMAINTIDAKGKFIIPGAIDGHVHIHDPGITHREDMEHCSMAAASGGVTTILSMPLNIPPTTDIESFEFVKDAYEGRAYIDYGIHCGATADNTDILSDLWNKTGASAIKMFMNFSVAEFPFLEDKELYNSLKVVAENNGVALIHAENNGIITSIEEEFMKENRTDYMAHNLSHPKEAEIEAITRALYFIEITGAEAVILHVSTAEGLERIHNAKEKGVKVWAESAPHLFTFIDEDMNKYGPYLKFTPVMHDAENKKRMWELIGKGYVDTIASDHSPYQREEKEQGINNIWKAPNGIPGLETSLAVFLNGVSENKLSLEDVVRMTSYNPSKIYGLYPKKGTFDIGADADIAVIDMDIEKKYTKTDIKTKCGWSPYENMTFKGWNVMTLLRGRVIYDNGSIIGSKGYGKYIPRIK